MRKVLFDNYNNLPPLPKGPEKLSPEDRAKRRDTFAKEGTLEKGLSIASADFYEAAEVLTEVSKLFPPLIEAYKKLSKDPHNCKGHNATLTAVSTIMDRMWKLQNSMRVHLAFHILAKHPLDKEDVDHMHDYIYALGSQAAAMVHAEFVDSLHDIMDDIFKGAGVDDLAGLEEAITNELAGNKKGTIQ